MNTEQAKPRWFIDLTRYQQSGRSFSALAFSRLCPKCRKTLKGEISDATLMERIRDCCSNTPGFIRRELPILESIFRLFLANGNEPLDLEELSKQLLERRSGDTYHTSVEILSRLLKDEQVYNIRPF